MKKTLGTNGVFKLKYIKKVLWAILAFIIILQLNVLVTLVLHPIGGGEYHEIFAYSNSGRIDVALRVYAEYIIIACVLNILLILLRYPSNWILLSIINFFTTWFQWRGICYFPYQSIEFHKACKTLLYTIFPIVMLSGFIAHFLSDRLLKWRRDGHLS
jgi:hypothetical protein